MSRAREWMIKQCGTVTGKKPISGPRNVAKLFLRHVYTHSHTHTLTMRKHSKESSSNRADWRLDDCVEFGGFQS
jgi:hypothetical protein